MNNKIEHLRNHLFAALERLNDEDLTPEKLEFERTRAASVVNVATSIIDSAKAEVQFLQVVGGNGTGFIPQEDRQTLKISSKSNAA